MRDRASGFALLESLVSFAILAGLLGAVYLVLFDAVGRQARALTDLESAAVARGLLTEYVTTWPAMDTSGQYRDQWLWNITEQERQSESLQDVGLEALRLYEVTIEVVPEGAAGAPFRMATVVVRQ